MRMTKEEAIEVIKSECYVFNPLNFDSSTRINTALDMAIKALEQEPRWIPVSESFPKEHIYDDGYAEPSETVLVQLNNGEMKTSRYWGSRESRKNEPWIDLSYPTTLEVVAWRPLPKPYKESEGDE